MILSLKEILNVSQHSNTFVKHKAAGTDTHHSTYSFKRIILCYTLEDAIKKTTGKEWKGEQNEQRIN